jgi:O-antigen/teichoic acid export membrane protein
MKKICLINDNAAGDATLLALVRLMTMCLSLITTRVLSTYLSTFAYGTYSQVLLIVSTTASLTTFGFIDAINFYYCGTKDTQKRESYVATILTMQCCIGMLAGIAIVILAGPICKYFGNPELRRYLFLAAFSPLLQNGISLLQVLLVSVGKARQLAVRNLIISIAQLICAITAGMRMKSVGLILFVSIILNSIQILFFLWSLKKSGCHSMVCYSK